MKKYRISNKRKSLYKFTKTLHDYYYDINCDLPKEKFLSIFKLFIEELTNEIIINRKIIELPKRNGIIRVRKSKIRFQDRKKLNYKVFNETGKKTYYTNMHTNTNYFTFYWDKTNIISKNKSFFNLEINKKIKQKLYNEIVRCSKNNSLKDYDALS